MLMLILSIFLYACESWTLTAEIERGIQALEIRCYRRLLNIFYKDHVTNEEVRNRIQNAIGVHDDLLTMVKKRKLRWYGHIARSSGMAKTILQGTVKGARRRGRQKKRWEDNIKEWMGMEFGDSLRAVEDREGWKGIVATSSVVPRRPPRLRDWDESIMIDLHYCKSIINLCKLLKESEYSVFIYSDFIWPILPPVTVGIPSPKMALFFPICVYFPKYNEKSIYPFPNVKAQVASQNQR